MRKTEGYAIFLILILFLIFPYEISKEAGDALSMCLTKVIPSLFPFMVVTDILGKRLRSDNPFFKVISKIFKISESGAFILFSATVCGYPSGARLISEKYENNEITKSEANHLMLFINNCGPSFAISTVGGMMLGNVKIGGIIYLSHILSSMTIGITLSFFPPLIKKTSIKRDKIPFSKAFVASLSDSFSAVLKVTAVIVFFSAFLKIFDIFKITSYISPEFSGILKGMVEMTGGLKILSKAMIPLRIKMMFSSFLITFGGISVFFQLKTFLKDIKIAPCIICKVLTGFLAMLICYCITLFFNFGL